MGSAVQPGRFLDSAIIGIFLIIFSAMTLYSFSEVYVLALTINQYKIGVFIQRVFCQKKSFDYTLMHIILFALLIALLSMKREAMKQSKIQNNFKNTVETPKVENCSLQSTPSSSSTNNRQRRSTEAH